MRLRLWPDSIFGRFLAVLLVSCALAQAVAAMLVIHRGGNLIVRRESPMLDDAAARVAEVLMRLASLSDADRSAALRGLSQHTIEIDALGRMPMPEPAPPPPLLPTLVQFGIGPPALPPPRESRADELMKRIRARVGDEIELSVSLAPAADGPMRPPFLLTASWPGEPPLLFRIASGATLVRRMPFGFNWLVGLQLAGQMIVVFIGVSLGAYVAAHRITRPLSRLAGAVDSLGRSLSQPPLPETGPRELRQVAQGFNVMQDRLRRYLDSRTRAVAAMSHDLRTPLTRVRLRLEMLADDEHRREFERDLAEMESMVIATLDALSDVGVEEATRDIDVDELLERLRTEFAQLDRHFTIAGRTHGVYPARPQALKRCLTNLIDNAFKYGDAAQVRVADDDDWLHITVVDRGPGIPVQELERVFEPFYRLESSRSRETGGAGLGLSVALDCAQAHGGRLRLRNGRRGGLEAELCLPRRSVPVATSSA